MHQFEKLGLMEKSGGSKGGRKMTANGQRDMDLIAGRTEVTTTIAI